MKKKIGIKESFKYEGNVTVDILLGDKIIKTVKGHNEGKQPLFEFLALCIIIQYEKNLRPNFIRLFANESDESDVLKELTNTAITHSGVSVTSSDSSAEASLRFLIPHTAITKLNSAGETKITALKIYNSANYTNLEGESVVYYLNSPIVIENNLNANVQVTWTLKISN